MFGYVLWDINDVCEYTDKSVLVIENVIEEKTCIFPFKVSMFLVPGRKLKLVSDGLLLASSYYYLIG